MLFIYVPTATLDTSNAPIAQLRPGEVLQDIDGTAGGKKIVIEVQFIDFN